MIDYAGRFKKLVEAEGYELLSEYKGNKNKVKLRCPEGHEYKVTPSSFKNGRRCPICSGQCPIQAKKDFIELVEKDRYDLLGEYKNTRTKVKLKCDKGHEYKVEPRNFKSGKRCPKCAGLCPIQAEKEFKELIEDEEYVLLDRYKGATKKVKLLCPKGHEYKVLPNNFKQSHRCPKCAGKCPIQAKEQFIELLAKEGYELLSEYINSSIKVELRCDKGHEYSVKPDSFKSGCRCPKCAGLCPIQAEKDFKELVESVGYELLEEYKGSMKKVKIRCNYGHEYKVYPNNFKNHYQRCPHCAGSTGQRLLQEMLKEYDLCKVIYNDREALGGLELDVYYPELNIAIEYQGNYWHSLPNTIINDKRKKILCKEKGIYLIEVWDNDFMKDQEKELDKIIGLMNNYNMESM